MATNKTEFIAKKAQDAGKLANKAGEGVALAWKDLSKKTRDGIQRAYEAKRPLAVSKLAEIRQGQPGITPQEAQDLLDVELNSVESTKGGFSIAYTSAASLYVITSMEIRQLDKTSKDANQKIVSLLVLLDSAAVRGIRRIVNVAIYVLPFLKGVKVLQGAGVAVKLAQVSKRAAPAKKILSLAKAAALPKAAEMVKDFKNKGIISSYIIDQSTKILGPTPTSWDAQPPKTKLNKSKGKTSKKK